MKLYFIIFFIYYLNWEIVGQIFKPAPNFSNKNRKLSAKKLRMRTLGATETMCTFKKKVKMVQKLTLEIVTATQSV